MKKLLIGLLAAGLVFSFSVPVMASDFKDASIAAAVYQKESVEAGMLHTHGGSAGIDPPILPAISPYVKATVGGVSVKGQFYFGMGDPAFDEYAKAVFPPAAVADLDLSHFMAYLVAKTDVGSGYVGGIVAYSEVNNTADTDVTGGMFSGSDWDPCLILFSDTAVTSGDDTTEDTMLNAYLFQVFAGASPRENLSVKASLTCTYSDEKPSGYIDKDYGTEFDVTASYKLYDNLDYTVGFGYLFTGHYFKGDDTDNVVDDTYLLMNRLQVNF